MMKCIYWFELNLRQMAPLLLELVKRSDTPQERERCAYPNLENTLILVKINYELPTEHTTEIFLGDL